MVLGEKQEKREVSGNANKQLIVLTSVLEHPRDSVDSVEICSMKRVSSNEKLHFKTQKKKQTKRKDSLLSSWCHWERSLSPFTLLY